MSYFGITIISGKEDIAEEEENASRLQEAIRI